VRINNDPSIHFDIDDLFQIVNDIRTGICPARIVVRPQPDFEVGQGAVPVKGLEGKCKYQAADMDILYRTISPACNRPKTRKTIQRK